MKLLAFFIVYFSIIISVSGYKIPWRVAFGISILYVFFLRQGGFQGDFQVYLEELKSGWFSIYYLREPFFWVGSKVLFSCFGNEQFVIFIYDFLFCFLLYKSTKKVADVSVFLIFLVSFPVFLGLENVYRQVLGLPLSFLFIYHCLKSNVWRSLLYILLASLFHNSYIVLAPVLIFCFPRMSTGFRLAMVLLFMSSVMFFVKYYAISMDIIDKSSAQSTGLNLEYLYLAVILFFSFSIVIIEKRLSGKWFIVSAILTFMCLISISVLGSSQSERMGMILILALLYFYFCLSGSGLKGRSFFVKLQMFFILAVPVFMFPSTREFLVPGGY